MKYSIGITTFVHRFDKYFKPLIKSLSDQRPDIDKIIFVNGEHKDSFDQEYRKDILNYAATLPNTYLVMSPFFRGCSYLWNTCINFSKTDYTLVLSDDLTVLDGFCNEYESMLVENQKTNNGGSFIINQSFAHISVFRQDIYDVGYFDERLLGIGEEDGDWLWRWETSKGKNLPNFYCNTITHYIESSAQNMKHTKKVNGKYSLFNRDLVRDFLYEFPEVPDPNRISYQGRFESSAQRRIGNETPNLYPVEKWFRDNIDSL